MNVAEHPGVFARFEDSIDVRCLEGQRLAGLASAERKIGDLAGLVRKT